MTRKLGINDESRFGVDLPTYVSIVKAAGFDCIFTGVPQKEDRAKMAELFAKNGLFWETMHAPFKGINHMWLPGEEGEAMLGRLTDAVDACAVTGTPMTVVHLSSGLKPPPVTDIGRERFARLVDYAGEKNVKIAFENQRMLGNIGWAFETFGELEHVGFCWDTGHENCFTPGRQYMPLFGHQLICTHIHDNSGVFDQDQHLIPFDGKLDFDRVARQLREYDYKGPLTLEVISKNSQVYEGYTCEQYIEKAAAAIKRLCDMVEN